MPTTILVSTSSACAAICPAVTVLRRALPFTINEP